MASGRQLSTTQPISDDNGGRDLQAECGIFAGRAGTTTVAGRTGGGGDGCCGHIRHSRRRCHDEDGGGGGGIARRPCGPIYVPRSIPLVLALAFL